MWTRSPFGVPRGDCKTDLENAIHACLLPRPLPECDHLEVELTEALRVIEAATKIAWRKRKELCDHAKRGKSPGVMLATRMRNKSCPSGCPHRVPHKQTAHCVSAVCDMTGLKCSCKPIGRKGQK